MRFAIVILATFLLGCQPRPAEPAHERVASDFRPSIHGFKFANGFQGSPLPKLLRENESPVGKALNAAAEGQVSSGFGLCGGMSIAAADFYTERRDIPNAAKAPAQGEPLYDYLDRRQLDSFGPGMAMATKFLQWMALPDRAIDGGPDLESLSAPEVTNIRARVEQGQFAVVGLVYVRAPGNTRAPESPAGKPWENHQVLAYACRDVRHGGFELLIYDPNFPGDDEVVLRFLPERRASGDAWRISRVTGTGRSKHVRGVFCMPFLAATPPPALGSELP